MRRIVLLAALAALPSLPAAADEGHPPDGFGARCTWLDTTDPTAEGDVRSGTLVAGPVVVASLPKMPGGTIVWNPLHNPATATVTCSVQFGATHGGVDFASFTYSGTVVVAPPPVTVTYVAPAGTSLYACTTWVLTDAHGNSTGPIYYDDATDTWSTSSTARCEPQLLGRRR